MYFDILVLFVPLSSQRLLLHMARPYGLDLHFCGRSPHWHALCRCRCRHGETTNETRLAGHLDVGAIVDNLQKLSCTHFSAKVQTHVLTSAGHVDE